MDLINNSERRTKQKRDPAWNYCQMCKNGDKVQLKCMFCGKIFKGGGIHRVKEHLAGAKGDGGSPCLSVDPDVRLAMLENLSGVVGKRRKKQRSFDGDEMLNQDNGNAEEDGVRNSYDLNTGVDLLPITDVPEASSGNDVNHDSARKEIYGTPTTMVDQQHSNTYKTCNNMELVPVGSLKRDLAWQHCQMYKKEGKVLIKCLYCGKIFNGGGIYRIKEHLAGRVGNGPVCSKVHPDVRRQMQENLNVRGLVVKKRKKQKLALEAPSHHAGTSEVQTLASQCNMNCDMDLLTVTDTLHDANVIFNREDEREIMGDRIGGEEIEEVPMLAHPQNCHSLFIDNDAVTDLRTVNDHVQMAIGRFLFYAGIPFDAVDSIYFQRMIEAIASQGSHIVSPSCNDLRSWILKTSVKEVKSDIDRFAGYWAQSGCSILVDEWLTEKGKTLVNVSISCSEGNLFFKSMDISEVKNSADALYELLRNVVDEVGERNVLQVITSNEERYVVAVKRLTDSCPSIFWTVSVGYCINLILEDFKNLEWAASMMEQAKSITRFIYNHSVVLSMMRRFTVGVDLIDIGVTQSVTDFMTLKRMISVKQNLQQMVTSEEWKESPYSRGPEGQIVIDFFSSETFWSGCALITRLADPFLRLLRIAGSEKRPAMGYVYAGLYRAKEAIKKDHIHQKDYLSYWNIIDQRTQQLWQHPILASGFYLNPKYFYSTDGDLHHIRSLLYDCVEKLVPDPNIQDKIVKETISYQNGVGDFGRKMAIRARDTLLPAEWWSTYGAACPNLARLAVRILSQTCSSFCHRPHHILLEEMHDAKNSLEHQRLSDLVFVQYNWWLRERTHKKKGQEPVDPISYTNPSVVSDWIRKKESGAHDRSISDWTTVPPPLGAILDVGSEIDDFEALGAGFDDYEVFLGEQQQQQEEECQEINHIKCIEFC